MFQSLLLSPLRIQTHTRREIKCQGELLLWHTVHPADLRCYSPRGSVCFGISMPKRHHLIGSSDVKPCWPRSEECLSGSGSGSSLSNKEFFSAHPGTPLEGRRSRLYSTMYSGSTPNVTILEVECAKQEAGRGGARETGPCPYRTTYYN
jgi:hypothetical protein